MCDVSAEMPSSRHGQIVMVHENDEKVEKTYVIWSFFSTLRSSMLCILNVEISQPSARETKHTSEKRKIKGQIVLLSTREANETHKNVKLDPLF